MVVEQPRAVAPLPRIVERGLRNAAPRVVVSWRRTTAPLVLIARLTLPR